MQFAYWQNSVTSVGSECQDSRILYVLYASTQKSLTTEQKLRVVLCSFLFIFFIESIIIAYNFSCLHIKHLVGARITDVTTPIIS